MIAMQSTCIALGGLYIGELCKFSVSNLLGAGLSRATGQRSGPFVCFYVVNMFSVFLYVNIHGNR